MNLTDEHPYKLMCQLYNEFRVCGDYERDYSPAENVYLDENQKPVFIEEEDEAAWTSTLTPPIEILFTFDKCDTDEDIKAKIKELQEKALNHKARHWASLLWAKNAAGRPLPVVAVKLKEINRCLETYTEYLKTGNKAAVSVKQGNFHAEYGTKQRQHSTEKITPYLNRANQLIEASGKGFQVFIKEAMKPVDK
ncbi:MAG: hypothetical protein A2Y12_19150 [Planctomycetes bacterium GWF2_42_9]|nr:MAG: hypothetical protein A2Y12_19150 [Planctomycetes bacterium GWF2_42_9]